MVQLDPVVVEEHRMKWLAGTPNLLSWKAMKLTT
jgi:hypothetical protein